MVPLFHSGSTHQGLQTKPAPFSGSELKKQLGQFLNRTFPAQGAMEQILGSGGRKGDGGLRGSPALSGVNRVRLLCPPLRHHGGKAWAPSKAAVVLVSLCRELYLSPDPEASQHLRSSTVLLEDWGRAEHWTWKVESGVAECRTQEGGGAKATELGQASMFMGSRVSKACGPYWVPPSVALSPPMSTVPLPTMCCQRDPKA